MENYFIKQKALKALLNTLLLAAQPHRPQHLSVPNSNCMTPSPSPPSPGPQVPISACDMFLCSRHFLSDTLIFSAITKTLMKSTSSVPFLQKLGQEVALLTMLSHSCISQTMLWLRTKKQSHTKTSGCYNPRGTLGTC